MCACVPHVSRQGPLGVPESLWGRHGASRASDPRARRLPRRGRAPAAARLALRPGPRPTSRAGDRVGLTEPEPSALSHFGELEALSLLSDNRLEGHECAPVAHQLGQAGAYFRGRWRTGRACSTNAKTLLGQGSWLYRRDRGGRTQITNTLTVTVTLTAVPFVTKTRHCSPPLLEGRLA